MKFIQKLAIVLFAAVGGLAFTAPITGCSAVQEQAFLSNAPAVIQGSLATATDLYAAYAAANQQLNGQKLSVSTGIPAAQAAANSLQSSNLSTAVTSVFDGLNALATSIKASNPSATTSQIVAAQSAQLVAAQVATNAAAAPVSTARLHIRYNHLTKAFVIESAGSGSTEQRS